MINPTESNQKNSEHSFQKTDVNRGDHDDVLHSVLEKIIQKSEFAKSMATSCKNKIQESFAGATNEAMQTELQELFERFEKIESTLDGKIKATVDFLILNAEINKELSKIGGKNEKN